MSEGLLCGEDFWKFPFILDLPLFFVLILFAAVSIAKWLGQFMAGSPTVSCFNLFIFSKWQDLSFLIQVSCKICEHIRIVVFKWHKFIQLSQLFSKDTRCFARPARQKVQFRLGGRPSERARLRRRRQRDATI